MSSYRIHIAAFLLVLFLVPQANNALHYFVLNHDFDVKNSDGVTVSKKHKTHDCDTSIFKISSVTTVGIVSLSVNFIYTAPKLIFHYTPSFFKEQKPAYRLRGPPVKQVL